MSEAGPASRIGAGDVDASGLKAKPRVPTTDGTRLEDVAKVSELVQSSPLFLSLIAFGFRPA